MADKAPTSKEILAKLQKDYGKEIGGIGDIYVDMPRLPTGIFPLDLALGGGIPLGKMTIVFGPESSGKTSIAYKCIVMAQLLYKGKKAVFIDVEDAFDAPHAKGFGIDLDRLIVIHPDFAEQAVDITEAFLNAPDVSIVVVDSLAALVTANEIASSSDKAIVGGSSALIGKMIRKGVLALQQQRKANAKAFSPAFLCINQIRHKIGVMFGDPETMPGGNAPRFAAACIIRTFGKNIADNKINAAMPAYKETAAIIRKWKFPILQVNVTYKMQMLKFGGTGPGFVDDWNTVSTFLKELDYLGKADPKKGGWVLGGQTYPTLIDVKSALYSDPETLNEYKSAIISEMLTKGGNADSGHEMGLPDEAGNIVLSDEL